jgi:hypothetical protein
MLDDAAGLNTVELHTVRAAIAALVSLATSRRHGGASPVSEEQRREALTLARSVVEQLVAYRPPLAGSPARRPRHPPKDAGRRCFLPERRALVTGRQIGRQRGCPGTVSDGRVWTHAGRIVRCRHSAEIHGMEEVGGPRSHTQIRTQDAPNSIGPVGKHETDWTLIRRAAA